MAQDRPHRPRRAGTLGEVAASMLLAIGGACHQWTAPNSIANLRTCSRSAHRI